ncbi:MAG: hypothetical protein JXA14_17495 [Anaerolineae bacterium]|nr:hypothetical protein [Anaerolineae bacterium]
MEAVITRHYLLEADELARGGTKSVTYIVALLFVWIAALSVGNILHELGRV